MNYIISNLGTRPPCFDATIHRVYFRVQETDRIFWSVIVELIIQFDVHLWFKCVSHIQIPQDVVFDFQKLMHLDVPLMCRDCQWR